MHVVSYIYIYTYTCKNIHTHTHTCISFFTYIYMYIYIYTHKKIDCRLRCSKQWSSKSIAGAGAMCLTKSP